MSNLTPGQIATAAAVLLASFVLAFVVRRVLLRVLDRGDSDRNVGRLTGRFLGLLVVVVGAVYVLRVLDVEVGPLLGALGVGGIALAFALQDILQNFVAGVLLQVRRPFRVGDQIASNDYEGTVRDVNLRTTELQTFDGLTVYLPNAEVLKAAIVNHTRTVRSRTTLELGVAYDTDLRHTQEVLLTACSAAPGVESSPPVEVWAQEFGDSAITFAVRYWHAADVAARWRVRHDVTVAVKEALDAAGVVIPFPQRALWFARDDVAPTTETPSGPV